MRPRYSVVIPAYNEESLLPKTLTCLKSAMIEIEEEGEVIVVDNNSTDRTAEIAREHGATVVFEEINQISRARNTGGKAANGDFLIFLDADTSLDSELLSKVLAGLNSSQCCGGGALVVFDHRLPSYYNILLKLWTFLSLRFSLAAGSFFFCLKRAFIETGGFSEAVYAGEEVWFSLKLKAWGKKQGLQFLIIDDPPVITSDRKVHWCSPAELLGTFLLFAVFPLASRYRIFTGMWYRRPEVAAKNKNFPSRK